MTDKQDKKLTVIDPTPESLSAVKKNIEKIGKKRKQEAKDLITYPFLFQEYK